MELVTTRDLWFFQTNPSPITTLWWTFIYAISSIQFSLFAIDCTNFGKQNNYFPKLTNPISHFQKIMEQLHNLFLQVHENDGWDEWYFKANFHESIDKKLTKTSQIIHVYTTHTLINCLSHSLKTPLTASWIVQRLWWVWVKISNLTTGSIQIQPVFSFAMWEDQLQGKPWERLTAYNWACRCDWCLLDLCITYI